MIECHFDEATGVYELSIKHGLCNEIGTEMLAALESTLDGLDTDKGRALILSSGHEQGFCAGADLRELYQGLVDTPKEQQQARLSSFLDRIHAVMDRLDMLPMTTIAVIRGVCFGGGFELALTCDLRIAERNARFCFPELRLGIIPGFGGIPRLKRELGNAAIRDLLMTGRSLNAKKALQLSLVSQMVGLGEGLDVARRMAQQAAHFDGEAARAAKAFIKTLPRAELEEEKRLFLKLASRPALMAALKRFVESDDIRPYL